MRLCILPWDIRSDGYVKNTVIIFWKYDKKHYLCIAFEQKVKAGRVAQLDRATAF